MKNFSKKIVIQKKIYIDKTLLIFIILLLLYSFFILWSASGQNAYIMKKKIIQTIFGIVTMFGLSQIHPRVYETLAPCLYCLSILLLIIVNIFGDITKGAQRWLLLANHIQFQPSELVKIVLPITLASYIHRTRLSSLNNIIFSLILIFIPSALIAYQPDLGNAILISISGLLILFLSGINRKHMIAIILLIICFTPIFWTFLMREYQRDRIKTLLCPDMDPLGSGYHIIQSKIAIGSGGWTGKGWLHGTQSQLEFLPERHTDFIFSVIGEELGFIGEIILILLYMNIIIRGLFISIHAQNTFGRILSSSFMIILFMYIFMNIGMTIGLLPVVGVPLPLMSHGGSALVVFLSSFGIVMSISIHQNTLLKI